MNPAASLIEALHAAARRFIAARMPPDLAATAILALWGMYRALAAM